MILSMRRMINDKCLYIVNESLTLQFIRTMDIQYTLNQMGVVEYTHIFIHLSI